MNKGDKCRLIVPAAKYATITNHLNEQVQPTCVLYRKISAHDDTSKTCWIVFWEHLSEEIDPYFNTPLYGGYVIDEADLAVI